MREKPSTYPIAKVNVQLRFKTIYVFYLIKSNLFVVVVAVVVVSVPPHFEILWEKSRKMKKKNWNKSWFVDVLWYILEGFFHAGIELYNPVARRAAPSGIYDRTDLATRAGLCPASQVCKRPHTIWHLSQLYLSRMRTLWDTFFHSHKHIVVMSY
jgi:hypothetical protein